jgi:hypothetical protein
MLVAASLFTRKLMNASANALADLFSPLLVQLTGLNGAGLDQG